MTNDTRQLRAAARAFAQKWAGRGSEKQECQTFWLDLLRDVLGVDHPSDIISFESQVKLSHTSFIDAYISTTKVLIEQKSMDKDLRAPIRQSDGTDLTPFQQAKRYSSELPHSKHPRWVVVCNFQEFHIYDMEQPQGEPEVILLADLEHEAHRLKILVDDGSELLRREMEVSIKAGEMVGRIYDAFLAQYGGTETEADLHSLNVLCVRLVFCLYAEDAGIFGKDQFYHYMQTFAVENMRMALGRLFDVLDTPREQRDRFLEDKLAAFPYVNGSLFRQQPGEVIPPFNDDIKDCLLDKASIGFDWSEISPTIFGAVFESTLNPETRRSGGMHYTSIENIHRVIDPLFMDDLRREFETLKTLPTGKPRRQQLEQFQAKLATLTFLDPACGSGNFLTETYMSLRRLENEVIEQLTGGQAMLGFEEVNPIRVNIRQFYGIEINDFAVTVATTALWIAEAQMMAETERIIQFTNDYLPLKTYTNIHEGNALRVDWAEVVDPTKLNYIIGNPPFVGVNYMSDSQREDMDSIWSKEKRGKLDYVTCWYIKAAELIKDTDIRCALVATNSICQGEQVTTLWKKITMEYGLHIDFAHRSLKWDSESSDKAHVHVVIVGFSNTPAKKFIYTGDVATPANYINGYLLDAPNLYVEETSSPRCDVPAIVRGSQATDDGLYLFTKEEKEQFVQQEPSSSVYFKRFMMGREFINNIERWCLWMPNIDPAVLRKSPLLYERVAKVKEYREKSKNIQTKKSAETPWRFGQYRTPGKHYIAFAKVSSQRRRYIPFGFLTDDIIPGDKLFTIPDATLYHLGILTSNVHMAWMRAFCGRMKSDYSYSTTVVYNNFPWPTPTEAQRAKIEETAQAILDARALYPDSSLADLYDEVTMPPELRKAHQNNDRAVMAAYGFPIKGFTESDCVAALLKLYQTLTN